MSYKDYFENKKITVMGLGVLGRGVGDTKFLAECGADLIVTDLKNAEDLKESLEELKDFPNIQFVLGEHRLEDFRNRDFILKAAGVPLDSPYITEAKKNNIPIKMSTALFAELSGALTIGITGTRGKSTTTQLIYEIIKKGYGRRKVFLGGNIRGVSTLALLKDANPEPITNPHGMYHPRGNSVAVLELDSWQLQGFGEDQISPRIAVFTTFMPDHLNYYGGDLEKYLEDKANIFKYQNEHNVLVLGSQVAPMVLEKYEKDIKAKVIITDEKHVPKEWHTLLPGEHNRYNIALAIEVARIMGINEEIIKEVVEEFKGVEGRLQFLREVGGVKIYNDNNATTPDATLAALKALGKDKNIVLIIGGADKNIDMSKLIEAIPKYCKKIILLPGTGSEKLKARSYELKAFDLVEVPNLEESVNFAMDEAQGGDIVLFSPAFASFGLFKNEYDRGDQFVKLIENFK